MKRTLRSNSIGEAMFFLFSVEAKRVCERNGFEVLPRIGVPHLQALLFGDYNYLILQILFQKRQVLSVKKVMRNGQISPKYINSP